jgi:hypothetical protein
MADEKRPLTLVWGSCDGWQMGGLPRDFLEMEGARPRAPQTMVTWRLTIRGLKRDAQRVKLETQNAGTWQVALEKELAVPGLRDWISERDGVLIFGFAGEVGLASANVRILRESTLFLLK